MTDTDRTTAINGIATAPTAASIRTAASTETTPAAAATTACPTTTAIAMASRRAARTQAIATRTIRYAMAGIAPAIAATTAVTGRATHTSSRIVTASRPATIGPIDR